MTKYLVPLFFVFTAITLLSCQRQNPAFPAYVLDSLRVPQNAADVRYYILDGTYQVTFTVNTSYPAKEYIQGTAQEMSQKGWKRLEYDPLNPSIKLNYAKAPGGEWDMFLEKQKYVFQWIDEWEDSSKNKVRYGFVYKTDFKWDQKARIVDYTKMTCLRVFVIFVPN